MQLRNEWGAGIYMSHGSSNLHEVVVLMKNGLDATVNSKILDPQGRFIVLKVEFNDNIYVLMCMLQTKIQNLSHFFRH